jgi:hypothetical protein
MMWLAEIIAQGMGIVIASRQETICNAAIVGIRKERRLRGLSGQLRLKFRFVVCRLSFVDLVI